MSTEADYRVHLSVHRRVAGMWVGSCQTRHIIKGARTQQAARDQALLAALKLHAEHHPDETAELSSVVTQCVVLPATKATA